MAELRLDQLTPSATAPADTDIIPTVENVATTHNHKSKTWTTWKAGIWAAIHAATSKGTPVDADELPLLDSATSYGINRLTLTNMKAFLKAYFDGVYLQPKVVAAQIYISAAGMSPQATNGCAAIATTSMGTNKQDVQTLDFDKDAIEYAQSKLFRMPSDYNGGTVTYSIDWKHAATTTNFKVAWAVDIVCYADDGALDASWGTAVQVNDTGGTTSDYYATPTSSAVTPGGSPAANCGTIVRVQRVATDGTNDTLGVDSGFIGCQINYTRS